MCTIDVLQESNPDIRFRSRIKTAGPELAFVNTFIDCYARRLNKRSLKSNILFMVEPLIDSGYPDLILMYYSDSFMENWRPERKLLSDSDLKILAYTNAVKITSAEQICASLGFSACQVEKTIELLHLCQMIKPSRTAIRSVSKTTYLGIKKVIAYEAKRSDMTNAISQAARNTRFSNESYVLTPTQRPTKRTMECCHNAGVGLIAGKTFESKIRPEYRHLPDSYITLKLNEWLGMMLAQRMGYGI